MPAVERSPWGSNWVDLMNQYSYRGKSQFDPLDLSQTWEERFGKQRPVRHIPLCHGAGTLLVSNAVRHAGAIPHAPSVATCSSHGVRWTGTLGA